MGCYNSDKDRVYYSLEELMGDNSLSEKERREIMTKSKTSVQVDAIHQKTVWVRSNNQNDNRYKRGDNSGNTNNGNYNVK